MPSLVTHRAANQTTSIVLALLLLASGLIALPVLGQASATGIAAGKYGSDQVFSTTGLVSASTCVAGTPATFTSYTVSRDGLSNPVTMTNSRYVSFFESGDSSEPWGARLFETGGAELRLNGSDWVSSTEAESLDTPVSFDTLRALSPKGVIYALSDEGFLYSGTDIGELFIANEEPLSSSITITPTDELNDCTAGVPIGKLSALQSTYSANSNVNQSINFVQPNSASLVRSVGSFGVGQAIVPISVKAAGTGTYTFAQSGTLPPGLAFDSSTGVISGTPTAAGPYNFTVTMSEAGVQVDSKTYTGEVFTNVVLDNTALRFGNGNQHSINSVGLFEQPFYRSPNDGVYYRLTFSNYPLDMAVGTGTRSGWPNSNVVDIYSAPRVSQFLDYRDYVSTSATSGTSKGYGKVTVLTTVTINSQNIEIKHVYSLGQTDKFVKIDTTSTNKSGSQVSNMHVWVGTRDDYVGSSDRPTKLKGNLDGPNGSFNAITNDASEARALRITTGAEGALFYSTTPGTNMSISSCCSFSNAYNVNPTSSPITLTGDGSYAAMLPVGDIQNNESATITWFYAAGALADLDAVAQAVAAAAAPPPPVVSRNDTSATISWDEPEIEAGSTIIGYNYRYSIDGGATWVTSADLPVSPRSATITGLDNEDSFIFQVRAITQVGSDVSTRANGAWSGSSEAEVLGAPEVPTLNSATGSDGSITIAFTPPASPISPITHYQYCLNDCNTASNWVSFQDDSDPPAATIPTSPAVISNVPNGGSYQVRIRAVNEFGPSNPSSAVAALTKPVWVTTSLGNVFRGTSFGLNLSVGASVTAYQVVAGAIPTGLTLNTSTGRISGTATLGGDYSFTIRATNSGGTADKTFSGRITPFWTPTTTTINGTTTSELNAELDLASAVLSSLSSGATVSVSGVPAGVSFTTSRVSQAGQLPIVTLTGTPEEVGTYTITVTLTDSSGRTVSANFTLEVTVGAPASSGGSFTPVPTPSPSPSSTPRPRPSASPTPSIVRPQVVPTPSPSATAQPAPISGPVLLPILEPIADAVFTPTNPIPQMLVDILAQPLAYVLSVIGSPELPQLGPTESLAYENGAPVEVSLVLNETESGYVLEGKGWRISLEASDSTGTPLVLDESGSIILNTDRVVSFSGTGFAPGSIVKVWLFSDPTELTTITADGNGEFSGSAALPQGIPEGQHTVQLNGLTNDGQIRSVALGVVVEPVVLPTITPVDFTPLWNLALTVASVVLVYFLVLVARKRWVLIAAKRRKRKEEEAELVELPEPDFVDPILAAQIAEATPLQQFPVDSRRRLGKGAPPNKRGNFQFRPRNT